MKVSGTATLHATPEQVWAALNDPAVLVRTIPGCEQLEAVGTDAYRMTVTAGVASIKGTYLGDVALRDHEPYSAFTLKASGAGAPGTVSADVKVRLEPADDGTTVLSYEADAVVGGAVGGVGQRVLGGVARKTAGEFFKAVDAVLTGPAVTGPAVTGPAVTGPDVAGPARTGPVAPLPAPEPGAASPPVRPDDVPVVPVVFTRPGTDQPDVRIDVRSQLPGAAVGAAIALLGVLLGWTMGRRSS